MLRHDAEGIAYGIVSLSDIENDARALLEDNASDPGFAAWCDAFAKTHGWLDEDAFFDRFAVAEDCMNIPEYMEAPLWLTEHHPDWYDQYQAEGRTRSTGDTACERLTVNDMRGVVTEENSHLFAAFIGDAG